MLIVHGTRALARPLRSPAIAIGNFDGVHLGHQRLFERARAIADAQPASAGASAGADHGDGGPGHAAVLTFEPHPAKVLAPALAPRLITTPARKLALMAAAGPPGKPYLDVCVVEPFTRELAELTPEAFIDDILIGALGARALIVGHDFSFGKARRGDPALLAARAAQHGVSLEVVAPVSVDGMVASSTKVREFVLEGRMDGARLLLGRDFSLSGEVVRGAGRGRGLGIPTANLRVREELLPLTGVYAARAHVGGAVHQAVVNIGSNPTFVLEGALSVEAHLLDFGGDLYGEVLIVDLVQRLRGEERFPGAEALKVQIGHDIQRARELLRAGGGT